MNKTLFAALLSGGAIFASASAPARAQTAENAPKARWSRSYCDPPRDHNNGPKPRGVRISVYSYFVVTNSDDGVRDRDVEVFGYLNINGQRKWTLKKKNAVTAVPGSRIICGWYDYDVMFDRPADWVLRLDGYAKDYDKGSDDDGMWNPSNLPRFVNIQDLYERQRSGERFRTMVVPGDRHSESADLILELGASKLIY